MLLTIFAPRGGEKLIRGLSFVSNNKIDMQMRRESQEWSFDEPCASSSLLTFSLIIQLCVSKQASNCKLNKKKWGAMGLQKTPLYHSNSQSNDLNAVRATG
uniref:Uncharacterized protein n=1 Tax=Romanomermis culicivorax TaxID=13658 RepID=A0A915JIR0_ROMCU